MTTWKEANGTEWTINDAYSGKDFTDIDFSSANPAEFNNTLIVNSCFFQTAIPGHTPPYDRFPLVSNLRFLNCNLDNVLVKSGMDVSDDGWNKNSNRVVN